MLNLNIKNYIKKKDFFNKNLAPYILYEKKNYFILDIKKISNLLIIAGHALKKKAENNNKFLFVGTDNISKNYVYKCALISNNYYINYRWLNGMFTNWTVFQKQINYLNYLEKLNNNNSFSKKNNIKYKKKISKLKNLYDGVKNMKDFPSIVIFSNQYKNITAINECLKAGIPVISLINLYDNPNIIQYPIINNNCFLSIKFILEYLTYQILYGYNIFN